MFIKRKIPFDLSDKRCFDIVTPYGYGGPVTKVISGKNEVVDT